MTSAPTRCGFTVPFWLEAVNTGTQVNNGNIILELDPLVTFIDANPAPSSINGSTLTWNFDNLFPTYSERIKLNLEMPGVDQLGETIQINAIANLTDDTSQISYCIDLDGLS